MDLQFTKVEITLERRSDGGLHVYSNQLPGLILSASDPQMLMQSVIPAINALVEHGAYMAPSKG